MAADGNIQCVDGINTAVTPGYITYAISQAQRPLKIFDPYERELNIRVHAYAPAVDGVYSIVDISNAQAYGGVPAPLLPWLFTIGM